MTEGQKLDLMKNFKGLNVAGYTTKYGDYYGLMFAGAEIATKELQKENARLNEQVNTYLEMLANETKKRIPDSKGSTVWEKSLTEKLAKAKEIIKEYCDMTLIFVPPEDKEKYTRLFDKAGEFLKEIE